MYPKIKELRKAVKEFFNYKFEITFKEWIFVTLVSLLWAGYNLNALAFIGLIWAGYGLKELAKNLGWVKEGDKESWMKRWI